MRTRAFLKTALLTGTGVLFSGLPAWSKTYLTPDQAARVLYPGKKLRSATVVLTRDQQKAIRKASRVNVRNATINAYRTPDGSWLIYDEVIGKHENIDMAFALDSRGAVLGMEVLVYRETYGHEVRNPSWQKQFRGKNHAHKLKLDREIENISGATLSCAHITDAVNRLTQTWKLVLQYQ